MYTITSTDQPSANLTVGKNRLKLYSDSTFYLKDKTEFEIELFNPTAKVVLTKIKINNQSISGGGIILHPGERVFLERYLDTSKKFLFETYRVAANNKQVEKAIQHNGKIEIEFFNEQVVFPVYGNTYNAFNTTTFGGTFDTTGTGSDWTNCSTTISGSALGSATLDMCCTDSFADTTSDSAPTRSKSLKSSKSKETGRIAEGSTSEQSFTFVNKNFESFHFHKVEYQILPDSEKQVKAHDIRAYCTCCGTRKKQSNWNNCPTCGNKF